MKERRASWDKIGMRDHRLYRVYTTSRAGMDLLAIGGVSIHCRNGAKFSQEFAQNFLLVQDQTQQSAGGNEEEGRFLIRKFQAWIVSLDHLLQFCTRVTWVFSRVLLSSTHTLESRIIGVFWSTNQF